MILYSGLLQKLNEKGLTKTALAKYRGYHQRTASHFEAKQHTKGHFIFYLGGCPFLYLLIRVWNTTLYVIRMHDFQYARNLATIGFFERSTRYRVFVRIKYFLLILYRIALLANPIIHARCKYSLL